MAHFPVNHRLRAVYRFVAALCGAYVFVFGIVALLQCEGVGFFAQDGLPRVLGLQANPSFAVLSIVVGAILLGGAIVGGNLDRWINLTASVVFLLAGFIMMVLLRTDLNYLGLTMTTCIVSFVLGLALGTAGLYGQVGSERQRIHEERFRHGTATDPQKHPLGAHEQPRAAAG